MQADEGEKESSQNTNTSLLRKLSTAINGHAAVATFACGGSVPIADVATSIYGPDQDPFCSPVRLRWDSDSKTISTISFPPNKDDHLFQGQLGSLLEKCQPATFGIGGQDVLDEGYRKAAKLDASDFVTNFHPHDCGILDSIHQTLLPSLIKGGQGIGVGPGGVRAELYKLNVGPDCY